ncbi:MAG TPA: hypothetical protein VMC09_14050 [Anaerolineales bacterium]|nr:hypothetical protein [Anaerolineales bacterium]
MNRRVLRPFFCLAGLILIVGLACATSAAQPTSTSVPTVPPPPTNTLEPTLTSTPAATPTPQGPPKFFTEDFNQVFSGDPPYWSHFLTSGSESKLEMKSDGKSFIVTMNEKQTYLYMIYNPTTYQNVSLDIKFDNRGRNTNNISLICDYSDDKGWYEFNLGSGGVWNILFFDQVTKYYQFLANGGSVNIHAGQVSNEYKATCQGNDLTLYINGVKTYNITDSTYALQEGKVGFSISSFDVLPIIVAVDSIQVSEP